MLARAPLIATGLAGAALVVAVVAAIGVWRRAPVERIDEGDGPIAFAAIASLPITVTRGAPRLHLESGDKIFAINGVAAADPISDTWRKLEAGAPTTLFVELERRGARRVVRWDLDAPLAAAAAADDALVPTITRTAVRGYRLPRATVEALLANPGGHGAALSDALVVTVQPRSIGAALGFASGDHLRAINGNEVASPAQVLEQLAGVRPQITVELVRGDQWLIFNYVIE